MLVRWKSAARWRAYVFDVLCLSLRMCVYVYARAVWERRIEAGAW